MFIRLLFHSKFQIMSCFLALLLLSSISLLTVTANEIQDSDYIGRTITRDVCIIGGGSGGTYSAIRLAQQGTSIIVIEKQAVLGGHTNTYIDPVTNLPVNYGVAVWEDIPAVRNYFSYLGVALQNVNISAPSPITNVFANFTSGIPVATTSLPFTDPGPATASYLAQLAKYPYLDNGYDLPSTIPSDLLIPFGNFITKYRLEPLAYSIFEYAQGFGNFLAQPTIYILKVYNTQVVHGIIGHFVSAASNDNHELYDKALIKLGTNALLESTVRQISRDSDEIRVVVSTPGGDILVKASKLLMTLPPKLNQLQFLDLDGDEKHLLGRFNNSYYWNGVVRNSGIPDNVALNSIDLAAPLGIPAMPQLYAIEPSGVPGLHQVYFGSIHDMKENEMRASILSTFAKLVKEAGYPPAPDPAEFVAFGNHSPFALTVSVDDIQNGFYSKLNALQGKHNTWWTGATWQVHDSSQIWKFTEDNILPKLLK
jgi:hypothetical protein